MRGTSRCPLQGIWVLKMGFPWLFPAVLGKWLSLLSLAMEGCAAERGIPGQLPAGDANSRLFTERFLPFWGCRALL